MSINTYFEIPGFTLDEAQHLFGYLGNSNTSGNKFSAVFAREGTNPVCGEEEYTVGEIIRKEDQLIQEYEKQDGTLTSWNKETIKTVFSILPKILPLDTKIVISWG